MYDYGRTLNSVHLPDRYYERLQSCVVNAGPRGDLFAALGESSVILKLTCIVVTNSELKSMAPRHQVHGQEVGSVKALSALSRSRRSNRTRKLSLVFATNVSSHWGLPVDSL